MRQLPLVRKNKVVSVESSKSLEQRIEKGCYRMNSVSLVDGHIDGQGLTDEQTIKALETHIELREKEICTPETPLELLKLILDLINRQNAEIEEDEAKLAHQAETIFILEKALSDRMADIERLEGILDKRCDFCPQNARIEALAKQIEELSNSGG